MVITSKDICPKCNEPRVDATECPACGVIYAKAELVLSARIAAAEKLAAEKAEAIKAEAERASRAELSAKKIRAKNLKACDTCSLEIARSAKVCPHCGAKQKVAVGKLGLTLAALFLVLIFIGAANQEPVDARVFAKETAKIGCSEYLKGRLRDPDSLVIDSVSQSSEPAEKSGSFSVITQLDVRAKNGFGGTNRENYVCEAEISGSNYRIKHFSKL